MELVKKCYRISAGMVLIIEVCMEWLLGGGRREAL
jgi:hypothetical protein